MICSICNAGAVEWQGELSNLTHTKCGKCGAINAQVEEVNDENDQESGDITMRITVTGIDEMIDRSDMRMMLSYPHTELGFLYTATPEGRNRYPSYQFILAAMMFAVDRCALHICGTKARQQLVAGELEGLVYHASRVQVNGVLTVEEAEQIAALIYPKILITQHNAKNARLMDVKSGNHSILLDGSGGRGISPEGWNSPDTQKPVGFAGGLGRDNLAQELLRIKDIARTGWWVDMENKLRPDHGSGDWMRMAEVIPVLEIFHRFAAAELAEA